MKKKKNVSKKKELTKNKKKKFNFREIFKGFTLVELLAVIIILAIIMVIAIPSVLNTMNTATNKTFIEFCNKVSNKAEEEYLLDTEYGDISISDISFVVYDIKKDLKMSNTGDYRGIAIVGDSEDVHYNVVVLYDDDKFIQVTYSGEEAKEASEADIMSRSQIEDPFNGMSLDNFDLKQVYALIQIRNNCGASLINVFDGGTKRIIYSHQLTDPEIIAECYAAGDNKTNYNMQKAIEAILTGKVDEYVSK